MSQIASFYLIKNNQRKELSDGNCSGAVYMAIWDWCEYELDLDNQEYNIGAVIGILTFIVLSIVALVTYRNTKSYKDEEGFM